MINMLKIIEKIDIPMHQKTLSVKTYLAKKEFIKGY